MASRDRDEGPWSRPGLHDVEVEVEALRGDLEAIRARSSHGLTMTASAPGGSIERFLAKAEDAARTRRWYLPPFLRAPGGSCVEAAYLNVHRAEAEIARLYNAAEADAAIPEAVARLQSVLPPGDIRGETVAGLRSAGISEKVLRLSQAIRIGHEAKDQQYAKIRRFRNIIVSASVLISVFILAFAVVVSIRPLLLPLCFTKLDSKPPEFCPAHGGGGSGSWDVWIVLLLGLLGGALAAAVSVRKIRGAPTPYNLATALAWLKVPSGALTAVGALIIIKGEVVPGLTDLDSQSQILAYALVFGYAQQLLTGLIDRRAGELVEDIPSKGAEGAPVQGSAPSIEHHRASRRRGSSSTRRRALPRVAHGGR